MPLSESQRWLAAQQWLDDARAVGIAAYVDRHTGRPVIEFPGTLAPSLREQFRAAFEQYADELRKLLGR
jgi:hypothetical protein